MAYVHQSSLFQIFNTLVRSSGEAREAVLQYFSRAININRRRAGMQVDPTTVSSDCFMMNLQVILLQFCEPFMDAQYSKVRHEIRCIMHGLNLSSRWTELTSRTTLIRRVLISTTRPGLTRLVQKRRSGRDRMSRQLVRFDFLTCRLELTLIPRPFSPSQLHLGHLLSRTGC